MTDWDDVDEYDWYSYLPWYSRWFKYGGGADFKRNLCLAIKRRSLMEFRLYRKLWYRFHHRSSK